MRLPIFKSKNTYKRRLVAFGGLNFIQNFSEGELSDCSGISHDCFPALTQRRQSVLDFECNYPTAATFGDKECIATNDALYYDRKKVGTLAHGKKSIAQLGSKIIIFPDKVYYDTKQKKFASLDGKCCLGGFTTTFTTSAIRVPNDVYETSSSIENIVLECEDKIFKYTDVSLTGGTIELSGLSLGMAQELAAGDIFSEISGNTQYRVVSSISTSSDNKIVIVNECITVKNVSKNVFSSFRAGDVVEISGSKTLRNNKEAKIVSRSGNTLTFAENTFSEAEETADIIIKRKIPDFSCICSYENRLWGCEGNTLYASALGDPLNFFIYDNLSTDSFAVESNTAGAFTAAAVYGNYCLFFKENCCYKLYGNRPANFQLSESFSGGISKEDAKSIVNLGGKIIYKGNGGVYSFYGGIPQNISEKLGNIPLKNCVAGGVLRYYYLSADTDKGREEFVYDTQHGLWSKSGVKDVIGYFSHGESMYRLMAEGVEKISEDTDCSHEWYAEFCPFDEDYYKTKNYSRLHISLQLFENAWVKAEVSCDGGEWRSVMVRYGKKKEHISIPCVIKNCHEVKLRLSGKGKSIIESVVREFSVN